MWEKPNLFSDRFVYQNDMYQKTVERSNLFRIGLATRTICIKNRIQNNELAPNNKKLQSIRNLNATQRITGYSLFLVWWISRKNLVKTHQTKIKILKKDGTSRDWRKLRSVSVRERGLVFKSLEKSRRKKTGI